jgi:hypothetical protein
VCVECGYDLTRARSARRGPSARTWAILGVIAVLAIGIGAGFAVGALTGDDTSKKEKQAKATTAPPTTPTLPQATTTPPATPPTTTGPTTPTTPTSPTTPTAPTTPTTPGATPPAPNSPPNLGGGGSGGAIASWPAGKTAYTVVLVSSKSKSQANSKAREAKTRGISAGVLHSNDYSSLNPGYWVAFAGQYKSASAARSKADSVRSQGFSQAYPRLVKK